MVERVGQLADQVGRANERSFGVRPLIRRVVRHWKPRHLDRLGDSLLVHEFRGPETLARIDLAAFDVKGSKHGVRRTTWWREACTGIIDDNALVAIADADSTNHSDIVHKQCTREV